MSRLLRPGGNFYLSVPIGQERVEFNAYRVFAPLTIIRCAESSGLQLRQLTVIDTEGKVQQVQTAEDTLLQLGRSRYNLGIFVFIKSMEEQARPAD
jgi:hypothetical protein